MEWGDLRIFLAIAREGTLAAAARTIGQSQPTMGRRLRALEQDVGQTLFQRTGNGFVLTDEGAAVLSHAERMEEEALALERQLAGQDQHFDGMLRLSASDWFGALVLTPVVAEFARMQPRVMVEIITSARHYSLSRREADMVFKTRPFDEPEAVSRRLMHMPYGVYIRSGLDHPRPGDGTGTPLVTMDIAHEGLPDAVWLKRMLPGSHVVSRSNDRDVQGRMCALGLVSAHGSALERFEVDGANAARDFLKGHNIAQAGLICYEIVINRIIPSCRHRFPCYPTGTQSVCFSPIGAIACASLLVHQLPSIPLRRRSCAYGSSCLLSWPPARPARRSPTLI